MANERSINRKIFFEIGKGRLNRSGLCTNVSLGNICASFMRARRRTPGNSESPGNEL